MFDSDMRRVERRNEVVQHKEGVFRNCLIVETWRPDNTQKQRVIKHTDPEWLSSWQAGQKVSVWTGEYADDGVTKIMKHNVEVTADYPTKRDKDGNEVPDTSQPRLEMVIKLNPRRQQDGT